MSLTELLKQNPPKVPTERGYWDRLAEAAGMTVGTIRGRLRRAGYKAVADIFNWCQGQEERKEEVFDSIEDEENRLEGVRVINAFSKEIRTIEDLIEHHKIDTEIWEAASVKTNVWNQGSKIKGRPGEIAMVQLHQISATFKRKDTASPDFLRKAEELGKFYVPKNFALVGEQGESKVYIVLGCVHIPFENKRMVSSILNYVSQNKVDGVVLAGDILDMRSLSKYDIGRNLPDEAATLWGEYLAAKTFFLDIESAMSPDCERIFLYGNHEHRFIEYLKQTQNSRLGNALLSPEKALGLEEKGWTVLNNWQEDYVRLGKNLQVIHGMSLSKNAAADHLSKSVGTDFIFFHTHRFQSYSNGLNTAYNLGFLGDKNSNGFSYVNRLTRDSWVHGFGIVEIDEHNEHHVYPVRGIGAGEGFQFNGKRY